jgi:hypothetical protein
VNDMEEKENTLRAQQKALGMVLSSYFILKK